MQDNKLPKLSEREQEALFNLEFFKHKQNITEKVFFIFNVLDEKLKLESNTYELYIPKGVLISESKISKGENYKGLPYIILDYPRIFKKENIFAFRSMFWWGKYFSFTLHLSGNYLQHFKSKIKQNLHKIKLRNTFISIGDNQWIHEITPENYLPVSEWNTVAKQENYIDNLEYLKLVRKLELNKWDSIDDFGLETYNLFLKTIT